MTTEVSLIWYICGETDDCMTVDMIELFENHEAAKERFRKKHDKNPQNYLLFCPDSENENSHHTENSFEKYGRHQWGL